MEIPVIDFRCFRVPATFPRRAGQPTQSDKFDEFACQTIANQVAQACQSMGFFYLIGHDISSEQRAAAFKESARFFQLPPEEKSALSWSSTESNLGYVGVGRESLNPGQTIDLKEAFNIGSDNNPGNPNRWPPALPSFRETLQAFYQSANNLAWQVLQALALALQLPKDFFVKHHQQPAHTLRLLHYPPYDSLAAQTLEGEHIRAGEHSDYGSITLLFQDAQSGLQVKTPAGEWIAATPKGDAVLVNLGDLMQRWSNDRFRSTPHRVVLPTGAAVSQSRYSMALFCDPDPQTLVTAVADLNGSQSNFLDKPQYEPITAGDYLKSRLQATY
ncbi:isopenicillin N synthase family oxygenase [Pseudanabaena sp. FACHB-2040]|uniref:isopenicillin N synthase family dioxygenase n=1 Tax=Pseudanabaena sp. FACHB-2040 TaxID=2692859 RepID=UPI001685FFD9|nr:isopenicillin N synthase family oxygenase [Pseudanabaena sp. FACHB-2040]MBD2256434.1 isopenicillin N synthase family oxygenase [Pseudanabaena sp. FACHB-2040]